MWEENRKKLIDLAKLLWLHHKGKLIGVLCGLLVGILFITIGFFRTLVLVLMAALGGFLGSAFDGGEKFQRLLERFSRRDR